MSAMTAVFKGPDDQWNIVQGLAKRNATISDTIDALIRMGFPVDCQWDYTLTLFGDKFARQLTNSELVAKAREVEAARTATAELNGWTR